MAGGLPGLSATLTHTDWAHRSSFHAYVRSVTIGRRVRCLLATAAALGWLGSWDASLVALLSVGCTTELSTGVKDPTVELLICFVWLGALGLLSERLADDYSAAGPDAGSTTSAKMLIAVAMLQSTLFHQVILPWYPYLPLASSVGAALLTLCLHPSWTSYSALLRLMLACGLGLLLPMVHLVLSYAARTIWCQEWLLAEFAPALYTEVQAEREAIIAAAADSSKTRSENLSNETGGEDEHAERAADATIVVVVGLPRSGTTYLFSLLERLHGTGIVDQGDKDENSSRRVVALSCYHILFYERCLVHCAKGPNEVARIERLIDEYFENIGLSNRLIDRVQASSRATEEYLHWLMPRHRRRRLDRNADLCGRGTENGSIAAKGGGGFTELSRRMLLVDEARGNPQHHGQALGKCSSSAQRSAAATTILHKNPEEEDAVSLAANLQNAGEDTKTVSKSKIKLVHIERSVPPLFNSLLGFFVTFFDINGSGSDGGGYAALNPYYFLFSAALLRPTYLPAWLGFATTRTEPMEVGLAIGRLSWLTFGPARVKQFLANVLTPSYLQRYVDLRVSVAKVSPETATTVSYEQLLADPVDTLQRLADFIGVKPAFDLQEVKPSPRDTPIRTEVEAALAVPETASLAASLASTCSK